MFMKKSAIAIALVLASNVSIADSLNYSYFEAASTQYKYDSGLHDETFGLKLSIGILDNYYASLSIENSDFLQGVDLTSLNFGYKMPISSNTDFYTELGYLKANFNHLNLASDRPSNTGYTVLAGVRSLVTDNLELNANLQHRKIEKGFTTANVEARYHFNSAFSTAIITSFNEDKDYSYGLNLRYSF